MSWLAILLCTGVFVVVAGAVVGMAGLVALVVSMGEWEDELDL